MIEFKILKKSKKSNARIGLLKTPHGTVETPSLVPVATNAAVKAVTTELTKESKTQILIANTYHLHLRPGEDIIKSSGGIHEFMKWDRPLMTDSGGFQVFSLGFGRDFQVGKLLKFFPEGNKEKIELGTKPKNLKITEEGVFFRSIVDGKKMFIGPKESIRIQEKIGADMIFAFDECTAPLATYEYAKNALLKTHKWAKICVETKKSGQALFGIVQGSHFKDLRLLSAKYINSLPFEGFGIGGDLGATKSTIGKILGWTVPHLSENKPRHLLGIGYIEDMEPIIKHGIDLFDCTVPTHYGRRGVAFTSKGKIQLRRTVFLKDKRPLDQKCDCYVCRTYKRNYLSHLTRAHEIIGMELISYHNLYFFNSFVENLRKKIKEGKL